MLSKLAAFTVQEKITLLAWNAAFGVQATMEQIVAGKHIAAGGNVTVKDLEALETELVQAQHSSALIAGLCAGTTTDQELLDFVQWADLAAQLEYMLDCHTELELADMHPASFATFKLLVRLELLPAWKPW